MKKNTEFFGNDSYNISLKLLLTRIPDTDYQGIWCYISIEEKEDGLNRLQFSSIKYLLNEFRFQTMMYSVIFADRSMEESFNEMPNPKHGIVHRSSTRWQHPSGKASRNPSHNDFCSVTICYWSTGILEEERAIIYISEEFQWDYQMFSLQLWSVPISHKFIEYDNSSKWKW